MKLFFLLVSLLHLTWNFALGLPFPFNGTCVNGKYPPKGRPIVPTFVVNLDLPPNQRWSAVANAKTKEINNLLQQFKDFILNFGLPAKLLLRFVDSDLGDLAETLPAPYGDELKGVAAATGLPLGEVVLYNIFYEVFTVCTSVIAQDTNGKLYHGRNLDFGLGMGWNTTTHSWIITDALRPTIVNLDFQKGNKTLYKAVNFAGYIGIFTAIKPNTFTLSMNERFKLDGGYMGILKWILGSRSDSWMGFLTRDTMEKANSYDEAKAMLANTTMLAPAYFILGGKTEGQACIITRSRQKSVDIWDMDPAQGQWYILETNYDHWEKPLFVDDRRTPANTCMKKITQKNVGFSGIFDVLSSKPVLNKLTTYTALMQVNSGALETYLQYCPDPCWLW